MMSTLLHVVPVLAAEKNKVPFYVAGGALALWAVGISLAVGLRRPDFPTNAGGERAVMGVTAVLVLLTAGTAVATSGGARSASAAPVPGAAAGAASMLSESADPSGALAFTKPNLAARAGRVTITFANMAPEMHNMTIAAGSTVLAATPTFQGGSHTLSLQLKPGTYVFYCSVPGHRQAGMQGTLTVS